MPLPFTAEQFFAIFREYNQSVWPSQVLLTGLALAATGFVFRGGQWSNQIISAILGLLWTWLALAYHLAFFARINPAAYAFAVVSLAGAIVFVWQGVFMGRLEFVWIKSVRSYAAAVLVVFSLFAYPVWSWFAGHPYPYMPTFGLPCPTTIFTIGVLAFLKRPHPRSVFIVPVLWCVVGATAAFVLGVTQDLALIVAGTVGIILLIRATASATAE
jgi:hypothetical protein